jgi:N6-L-threonylcarbamoyladenine synthase
VDYIAVTRGPGLLGSLLAGLAFAKALAAAWSVPLVGVNHLHAHLLAAGLERDLDFPALGLLVSGGHTHLYRMDSPVEMTVLGRTLDDAAGEACDKFAKMAGLPYPGGALLDALGQTGQADPRLFPRPLAREDSPDFSFSGLKTAGALWLRAHPEARLPGGDIPERRRPEEAPQALRDAAASFLLAVADTLRLKTLRAMSLFRPRCLVVAGGVAANSVVRRVIGELAEQRGLPLRIPDPSLCTDNAIMVAWNGLLLARRGLRHDLALSAVPRGQAVPADWLRPGGAGAMSDGCRR